MPRFFLEKSSAGGQCSISLQENHQYSTCAFASPNLLSSRPCDLVLLRVRTSFQASDIKHDDQQGRGRSGLDALQWHVVYICLLISHVTAVAALKQKF